LVSRAARPTYSREAHHERNRQPDPLRQPPVRGEDLPRQHRRGARLLRGHPGRPDHSGQPRGAQPLGRPDATSLRSTREGGEEFSAYPVELTFEQAKHIIEALKDAPRVGQAPEPQLPAAQPWKALAAQVPDGRYAVRYEGDKAHFYRVSRKANGFVKLQEQASDSWFEKRLAEYTKIFEAITKAGVENAGRLYGELIGECRRCGRALTDEHNPYKGIGYGPDCGAKA
jgi:hypothetical protein